MKTIELVTFCIFYNVRKGFHGSGQYKHRISLLREQIIYLFQIIMAAREHRDAKAIEARYHERLEKIRQKIENTKPINLNQIMGESKGLIRNSGFKSVDLFTDSPAAKVYVRGGAVFVRAR